MKVSLVLVPTWAFEKPHLGASYLISYLKSKGHGVVLHDSNIEMFRNEHKKFGRLWEDMAHILRAEDSFFRLLYPERFEKPRLKDVAKYLVLPGINLIKVRKLLDKYIDKWVKQILDSDTKVIGFSINGNTALISLMLAKEIKRIDKSKFIVFGGTSCNINMNAKFFVKTGFVDAVVTGEGEEIFVELIEQLEKYGHIKKCLGVVFRKKGELVYYGDRPLIQDLDSIPFPDYDEFDLDKYIFRNPRIFPFTTGRGCPFACNFCMDRIFWKKYRGRSVDNMIEEFKFMYEKYGVKSFGFNDLTINANITLLGNMAKKIIQEKLDISWAGTARFTPGLNKEVLRNLRDAGCRQIDYGLESASNSVRKRMNKLGYDKEYASKVLKTSHELGIKQALLLIIGYIGETKDEFYETVNFVLENKKYLKEVHAGCLYIMKGTSLYEVFKDKLNVRVSPRINFKKSMDFWREYYYPDYAWTTDDPKDNLQNRLKRVDLLYKILKEEGLSCNFSGEELTKVIKNETFE